jgi:hypothetical protein
MTKPVISKCSRRLPRPDYLRPELNFTSPHRGEVILEQASPSSQKALRVDVDLELDGAVFFWRVCKPVAQVSREVEVARRFHQ